MPTVVRTSDHPYRWKIGEAKLSKVANVERFMPKSFISKDGFGITAKARRYLAPLISGEDYPTFKNGVPQYVRLQTSWLRRSYPANGRGNHRSKGHTGFRSFAANQGGTLAE